MLRKILSVNTESEHRDLTAALTNIFSSPYSLSKSFLKKLCTNTMDTSAPIESEPTPDTISANSKQMVTPDIGVDIDSVNRVSTYIYSHI